MDEPRGGRRSVRAVARVCLIVVLSLSTAAAAASITGWLVWRVSAEQPSASDARAMVEPLLPAGSRITSVAADRPGTDGGLPTWMWFDEATDGGYTHVEVSAPGGDWSGSLDATLVDAMRAGGWRAGHPASEPTAEVEGIRDGVYLYSDWSGAEARSIALVRDSWPFLRWSVLAAWAVGLVLGAVVSVLALRHVVRQQVGGRRGPEVRALAVVLTVLGPATYLATVLLGVFLDPTRHEFALDFWGAYTLAVPSTALLVLVVVPVCGVVLVARRLIRRPHAWRPYREESPAPGSP